MIFIYVVVDNVKCVCRIKFYCVIFFFIFFVCNVILIFVFLNLVIFLFLVLLLIIFFFRFLFFFCLILLMILLVLLFFLFFLKLFVLLFVVIFVIVKFLYCFVYNFFILFFFWFGILFVFVLQIYSRYFRFGSVCLMFIIFNFWLIYNVLIFLLSRNYLQLKWYCVFDFFLGIQSGKFCCVFGSCEILFWMVD